MYSKAIESLKKIENWFIIFLSSIIVLSFILAKFIPVVIQSIYSVP